MENAEAVNEIDSQNFETEEEPTFTEDMDSFFEGRSADRAEEAEADAAEQKRFKENTDETGEFKSLADADAFYQEDSPEELSGFPNYPNKKDYGPDQQEEYQADKKAYMDSGGRLRADGNLSFPDDPHGAKRRELMAEDQEWAEKEYVADRDGNRDNLDRARHFRKDIDRQMRALPEPPQNRHNREMESKHRDRQLSLAFDPKVSKQSFWNSSRLINDFTVLANEQLIDPNSKTIVLPEESGGRYGSMKPLTPKTAILFDNLPDRILTQIREQIQQRSPNDPEGAFMAAYSVLHSTGQAPQGKFSPARKKAAPAPKKKAPSRNPKNMSQSEYEQWRESQGASRF